MENVLSKFDLPDFDEEVKSSPVEETKVGGLFSQKAKENEELPIKSSKP